MQKKKKKKKEIVWSSEDEMMLKDVTELMENFWVEGNSFHINDMFFYFISLNKHNLKLPIMVGNLIYYLNHLLSDTLDF